MERLANQAMRNHGSLLGNRRKATGKIGLLLLLVFVQGCGFQPLYAPRGIISPNPLLERIKINTISERAGMQLRNHLCHLMTPQGCRYPALYTLSVSLSRAERLKGFRIDSSASSVELTYTARFQLTAKETGKVVLKDSVFAVSSCSTPNTAATAVIVGPVAAEAAENDVMPLLARSITERVATHFLRCQEQQNEN